METTLTQEIIESFGMRKKGFKPDYDDAGNRYTLPCGHDVEGFFMLNGDSCNMDSLEGLGGYLYITTKEELELIHSFTDEEQLFEYIEKGDEDFDRSDFE